MLCPLPSVRPLSVYVVTKRFVLEQKLLLSVCSRSYMKNPLVPKWMTVIFVYRSFKVMSTIASHWPLNMLESVRNRGLILKRPPIGNGLWGIKWSSDRWSMTSPETQKVEFVTLMCLEFNVSKTAEDAILQQSGLCSYNMFLSFTRSSGYQNSKSTRMSSVNSLTRTWLL